MTSFARPLRIIAAAGIDLGLLSGVLALLGVGLLMIFSASAAVSGGAKVLKQLIFAVVGLAGMGIFTLVDYRVLSRFRNGLYAITLGLLVLILVAPRAIAPTINGAKSWFILGPVSLQPSEFAKLLLILAFGAFLTKLGPRIHTWPAFLRGLAFFAVPILLVMAQPDLGTAMILSTVWLAMTWLAGARWWMLLAIIGGFLLIVAIGWNARLPGGRPLIKDYQKQRLDFIHANEEGSGYHQAQARIAIGAGQLWGKGYRHGTQAQRGFLPEQDTDFIFAVVCEELGFLGAFALLGLYGFVLYRLLRVAEEAENFYGRIVTGGIAAMLAMHVMINVGMNLTLSPVTGIPLPFISYGGSNLLVNLLSVGIALNISRHRQARRSWASEESELIRV